MHKTCGAKTRGGAPCQNTAVLANGRCRMHGGKSLVGVANPAYVHGRYAKLPAAIHAEYLAVKADPTFLSVAEELHVLRALAAQLTGGFGGDVVAVRREVGSAWDEVQAAKADGHVGRMKEAMAALERAIADDRQMTTKINELIVMFDNIRKLAEAETKRTVLAKEMLTRAQAQLFAGLVQHGVLAALAEVNDPDERRRATAVFTSTLVAVLGRAA